MTTYSLTSAGLGHLLLGTTIVCCLLIWFVLDKGNGKKQERGDKRYYFHRIWRMSLLAQMVTCVSGVLHAEARDNVSSISHFIANLGLTTVGFSNLLFAMLLFYGKKDNAFMAKCLKYSIIIGGILLYVLVIVASILSLELGSGVAFVLSTLMKTLSAISIYTLYYRVAGKERTSQSNFIMIAQFISYIAGLLFGLFEASVASHGWCLVFVGFLHYLPITVCKDDILHCLDCLTTAMDITPATAAAAVAAGDTATGMQVAMGVAAGAGDGTPTTPIGGNNGGLNGSKARLQKTLTMRQVDAVENGQTSYCTKTMWLLKAIHSGSVSATIDGGSDTIRSESGASNVGSDIAGLSNGGSLSVIVVPDGLRLWFYTGFIAFMALSVLVTSTFTDIDYTNNYIFNRIGYNNICIYFDDPPFTYVAATLFVFVLMPLYIYLLLDNIRVYFYYRSKQLVSKLFYQIYTFFTLFETFAFVFVIQVFATTPRESFLMHFIPYWCLLLGLASMAISHFILFIKVGIIKKYSFLYYVGIVYIIFGLILILIKYVIGLPLILFSVEFPQWTVDLTSIVDLLYVLEFFILPAPIYIVLCDRLRFIKIILQLH